MLEEFRAAREDWQFIDDDRQIHGSSLGEGRPLYFLNGIIGNRELFSLTAWLLRDRFRCVLLDYPARQRSDDDSTRNRPRKHVRPVSIENLAAGVVAAARALGDDRVNMYGTGFGAAVALQAALDAPEAIERVILHAGFARRKLSPFERFLCSVLKFAPGRMQDLPGREAIQRRNHLPWFPGPDPSRWEFFLDNSGGTSIADAARRAAAIRNWDLTQRLSEVAAPVLILRTEGEGRIAAACQEALSAGLPASQVDWIPDCGQLPQLTHTHRLAKVVAEFCSDGEKA